MKDEIHWMAGGQVRRLRFLASAGLLAAAGCGTTVQPDEVVPLDKVPPAIMKKAQETLPGYTFTGAWRKIEDGKDVFEVRGKNKQGQTREVEISPQGEVVTVE
jgi:hypothetical protein